MTKQIGVSTSSRVSLEDITPEVKQAVRDAGIDEGQCLIFVPHTTCGVTINENADPDVKRDIIKELNSIVPFDDNYRHMEGNSAAHIKASMMGFQAVIPISRGQLTLGTWQDIYLCEFDGPRHRKVIIQIQ
ncbi:MAG: secondary thiamine-phosphate synthase enzyme YjbQ [Spirochaetales bacterium]|nr:secondary thiamine-phosphate synthase enzyme YjbQ [Spirochaetales bacterium]